MLHEKMARSTIKRVGNATNMAVSEGAATLTFRSPQTRVDT